jgi:hypothetical protein
VDTLKPDFFTQWLMICSMNKLLGERQMIFGINLVEEFTL